MLRNLQDRRKKDLGIFYTPTPLASLLTQTAISQYLTNRINSLTSSNFLSLEEILKTSHLSIIERLDDIINRIKILDGAAGDGEFLRASFTIIKSIKEKLDQKLSNLPLNSGKTTLSILKTIIYGMEIDPNVIKKCHRELNEVISEEIHSNVKEILQTNIIQGDFLKSQVSAWKNLSPGNKFDIILGNPPWGGKLSKTQRDYFQEYFMLKSPKRNLNTASLFVYQATSLLTPNEGVLAYFLPKNVARSNQYTYLREFVVNKFRITNINFYGLFQNVTQEFISLIGIRAEETPLNHKILIDGKKFVPQAVYRTNFDFIFAKEFDSHSQKLITQIYKDLSPLNQFVTIKRGEELSKRGGVMYCPYCLEWVPLSTRKPQTVCSQCHKTLRKQELKINYLIKKEADEQHTQPILTGDDFDAFSINTTHFIDPLTQFRSKKDPIIYQSPKLVIQKIKRTPCVAYDITNHWTTQNVYNLKLRPPYKRNSKILYYILAVLNSSLYQWFYEYQFNLGSKYTNAISIRNLRRLPLKEPDIDDPLFHRIVDIAEKLNIELDQKSFLFKELNMLVLKYYNCENIPLPAL